MNDDEKVIRSRLLELSDRSRNKNIYQYSVFLSMNELSILNSMRAQLTKFTVFGGYPMAERCIACFGDEEDFGYPPDFPLSCIRISPRSSKFADNLTHRDFLGALMSLGIVRERLGDIVIHDNSAYLFCHDSLAQFICDSLTEVKHTYVNCELTEGLPEIMQKEPDQSTINIASERIDAVISAIYRLSRSESQKLFAQKLVFINSKECVSPSAVLKENDVVSIRHKGRFVFCGLEKETKKGRLVCSIRKYQ